MISADNWIGCATQLEAVGQPHREIPLEVEHRVYPSTSAKMTAIAKDAHDLLGQREIVLVTTHFSDSLGATHDALSSAGVVAYLCATPFDMQRFTEPHSAEAPAVALALARLLSPHSLSTARLTGRSLVWIVAEHHPTLAGDDAILDSARALADTSTVRFYDSLDSPLFMRFGGEWVRAMWATLMIGEDEYISHPMVTRTISQAQARITKQARSTLDATSAEARFRQNLP